jgi:flagellar motor switch protein FliM
LAPLGGTSLITVDPGLMSSMFTKLLGGPIEEATQVREFTAVELGMARQVIDHLLGHLKTCTEPVVDLHPQVERIETNPAYLNVLDDRETVLNLHYDVGIETVEGTLDFHIPLAAFEPVRTAFDPREHATPARETTVDRFRLERTLQRTEVEVAVRLQAPTTPLAEVAGLVPDAVLRLGHPVSRTVEIEIEGQALWRGLVGQSGEMRAVRIVEPIEEN